MAKKILLVLLTLIFSFSWAKAAAQPMNLKAKQEGNGVILNWDRVSEATYYKIFISGSMPSDGKIADISKTNYTHKDVKENETYSYAVRAYKTGQSEPIGKGDVSSFKISASTADTTTEPTTTSGQPVQIGAQFPGEPAKVTLIDHIYYAHRWASYIGGLLAVFMIVFAGFKYTTSGGNPEALQDAKDTIIGALIGLVIIILTYFLLQIFGTRVERITPP